VAFTGAAVHVGNIVAAQIDKMFSDAVAGVFDGLVARCKKTWKKLVTFSNVMAKWVPLLDATYQDSG
jgi:hypothetical protein